MRSESWTSRTALHDWKGKREASSSLKLDYHDLARTDVISSVSTRLRERSSGVGVGLGLATRTQQQSSVLREGNAVVSCAPIGQDCQTRAGCRAEHSTAQHVE